MSQEKIKFKVLWNSLSNFECKNYSDIEKHLQNLEKIITYADIPDDLKPLICKSKFEGLAKEIILENEDINSESDFEILKEKLKLRFKRELNFEEEQSKFMSIKQQTTQTIEDFRFMLESAAHKYFSSSGISKESKAEDFFEILKLTKFLQSIDGEIAYELRKNGVKNFEEAIEKAKIIELAKKCRDNAQSVNNVKLSGESKEIIELIADINMNQEKNLGKLQEQINELANDNGQKSKKLIEKWCHICGYQTYHDTKYCKFNEKRNQEIRNENNYFSNRHNKMGKFQNRNYFNGRQNYSFRRNFNDYRNNFGNYANKRYNYGRNWNNNKKSHNYNYFYNNNNNQKAGRWNGRFSLRDRYNVKANNYVNNSNFKGRNTYDKRYKIASINCDKSKIPLLNFNINGVNVTSLADSGASVSILSRELLEQIKQTNIKIKYLSQRIKIYALNDSVINFRQCIKITFKLDKYFATGTFFVVDHLDRAYGLLMGFDFLQKNKMVLDFEKKVLKFKDIELPLHYDDNIHEINVLRMNPIQQNVRNDSKNIKIVPKKIINLAKNYEELKIPPNAYQIMQIKIPSNIETKQLIFIEIIEHGLEINCEDSVHEVTENKIINIIVQNKTDQELIIQRNHTIGYIFTEFDIKFNQNEINEEIECKHQINELSLQEVRELREKELEKTDFNVSHLDEETQNKILDLLMRKAHAFSKNYLTLGKTDAVVPKFDLIHDFPIQSKPYRLPNHVKKYANEELGKLIEAGILIPGESNYAFPICFVKKKQNKENKELKFRMVCDFRTLNEYLIPKAFPMPNIRDILQRISGKKWYTAIDLKSAFFQILLRPEDQQKLAIITEDQLLLNTRLPFGTSNSSTIFAECIAKVLGPIDKTRVVHYLDDILIGTDTIEEMLEILQQVLDQLIKYNMTIEPLKMQLCENKIVFLGFQIDENGFAPSDNNINKINSVIKPKDKKAVKSFIACANYFRGNIHKFAEIINPLVELTKEKARFKWTEKHDNAFETIKKEILKRPNLIPPDDEKPYEMTTDASQTAISSILMQEHNGELKPVEYFSRKLKDSERHYPIYQKELLAMYASLMHFRNIILGREILIKTDSKGLIYNINFEKVPEIVRRWIINMQEFNFKTEFIKGTENGADFLSRYVNNIIHDNKKEEEIFKVDKDLTEENILNEQKQDGKLKLIMEALEKGSTNKKYNKFELLNGILILKRTHKEDENILFIAPEKLKEKIMISGHLPHWAFRKCYDAIKRRFFWFKMYQDIKRFCANCHQCNLYKNHNTIKVPIQTMKSDFVPGHALQSDIVGRLPRSRKGNIFVLTIMDVNSRYLEAIPLRNVEARTIINQFNEYFARFGLAKSVQTDLGKYYWSKEFKEYLTNLNIELNHSSPRHPTSQGKIENSHHFLKQAIAACSQNFFDWEEQLLFVKLHRNTMINRATGYSPSMLFFTREILTPFTNFQTQNFQANTKFIEDKVKHMEEVYKLAQKHQRQMEQEYVVEKIQPKTLNIGDKVYMKRPTKPNIFEPKFLGFYYVTRKFRNSNYLIENPELKRKSIKIHISQLFRAAEAKPEENKTNEEEKVTEDEP